jgi:polyphosphate kinase
MRKFVVAPFELHAQTLHLIRREAGHAAQGLPARIVAKMNSLVDPEVIEALYAASQAGVEIDLVVRGICCLRPGRRGLSERIRVRSIVDRFLEHSRVFYFENACQPQIFLGSADWMPRNFHRRIEIMFPVEDGALRERIVDEVLAANLADNCRARLLRPDGTYEAARPAAGQKAHRSQAELMRRALAGVPAEARPAGRSGKYPEVTVRRAPGR